MCSCSVTWLSPQVPSYRYMCMQATSALVCLGCLVAVAYSGLRRRRAVAEAGSGRSAPGPALPSDVPWSRVTFAAALEAMQVRRQRWWNA